jgi:phage/plasmid primase-like uncharacterized protein
MINSELLLEINNTLSEIIPPFELDGNFHHFKNGKVEKNSSHIWACGNEWEYKGNTYQYVTVGDWRDGSSNTFKSYDAKTITKQERKAAADQIKAIEETVKRDRDEAKELCKSKWEPIYRDLQANSDLHEYLRFKRSDQNYRARVKENTLIIPVEDENGFCGAQLIFKDNGKYQKKFTKGIKIKGSFCRLKNFDIKKESTIYLTEGYATACSVYMALKKPVICCFNAGNIIPSIVTIRSINPNIRIIIAGDNDHQNKKNPGKYYSSLASKQFSNVVYRLPKFENADGLTDFNDLHVCESLEKVSEQLEISNSDFLSIITLGHNTGRYFYVNTQTSELFDLTASQHTPVSLLSQATSRYWGQRFRFKLDKEGNPTSKPDWDNVIESLFAEHREVGFFSNEKVRGYGAWIDNGSVIFNSGKNLHEFKQDGSVSVHSITEHKLNTEFIYEANKEMQFSANNKISRQELDSIIECFSLASFKNENDYIYIIGFIALAQIPGVLSWRSNTWLTGPRGSGKTTILSWASQLCYNQGTIQDPTAAGLRQEISNNALPIFIDETEPNNPEARRRLDNVMDLARQSSSANASRIIRGTADGKSQSYLVSAIFMFCSIQVSIKNAADISRFTVLEMTTNKRDNFNTMKKISANFDDYSKKLLPYVVSESHNIIENSAEIHSILLDDYPELDSRQADQLSVLIAGYYSIAYGGKIDHMTLSIVLAQLNIESSEYLEDNKEGDENRCLDAILSSISPQSRQSIAFLISKSDNELIHNELQDCGIKVVTRRGEFEKSLFIQNNSYILKKILSDTEYQDYSKILKRSKFFKDSNAICRIHGVPKKGIYLDISFIMEE